MESPIVEFADKIRMEDEYCDNPSCLVQGCDGNCQESQVEE